MEDLIQAVLKELPIKRFRLMSYWSEVEPKRGSYDFAQLDAQVDAIEQASGQISLCLGLRQPRWPECHMPKWVNKLNKDERESALMVFIEAVVRRYKGRPSVVSYQLENESLNRGFGQCPDFDRGRLRREYKLVKSLDSSKPIIMSTSNSWGLPIRNPRPDIIGFSYYLYQWENGGPSNKPIPWQLHWLRRNTAKYLLRRESICHELQAEPWGPKGNELLDDDMQRELMDAARLERHIEYARKTGVRTIDLWGVEWWYWRKNKHGDSSLWDTVKEIQTSV